MLGVGPVKAQDAVNDGDDTVLLVGADESRDLGELFGKLVAIARRDAPAHDDARAANALLDLLGEFEGGLDALGGGRSQERARVDDDGVGVGGGVDLAIARCEQKRAHAVGIDLVFSAAERDEEQGTLSHWA